jgi:hypothetical protein
MEQTFNDHDNEQYYILYNDWRNFKPGYAAVIETDFAVEFDPQFSLENVDLKQRKEMILETIVLRCNSINKRTVTKKRERKQITLKRQLTF